MISVIENGPVYEIRFKYDRVLINMLRDVPGRQWNVDKKIWTIPKEHLGWFLNTIKDTPYETQVQINSGERLNENSTLGATKLDAIPDIDISDMDQYVKDGAALYPHQLDFLKYSKSKLGNGFILADDMGCGKTLEVMNYALYRRKVDGCKHCLIICCVNSAKFSWKEDIETHTNGTEIAYILGSRPRRAGGYNYSTSGDKKLQDLVTGHMYGNMNEPELPYFIITNIEALRTKSGRKYVLADRIVEMINSGEISMIAIDEIHKNASPKSTQGKIILDIKKRTNKNAEWIPMTGTPIVNRPTDVYTPLKLVNGHSVKSYWAWCQSFCMFGGYDDHEVVGYKNIPYLKELLHDHMLRRLKTDVLKDLPPKIYYTEYVENTPVQMDLYQKIKQGIMVDKSKILSSMNPLAQMLRLRQVNGSPELVSDKIKVDDPHYLSMNAKLTRLLEIIDDAVERGEKIVVFSNWVEPLRTVYKYVSKRHKTACYTGTMTEEERQKHKRVFINNPEYKVMLGTIGALGVNHTLTVANNCVLYDIPWQNAARIQAEDRLVRIGQSRPVNVYTLITKDTIDEAVYKILTDKQAISDYMVDDSLDIKKHPELFDLLIGD